MKTIIGALVAGLLIMVWQTASHTFLQLHANQERYTPAQDTILQVLSQSLPEGGQYFMPNLPPGSSTEAYTKLMEDSQGKPWAHITYFPAYEVNMGMNMLRGFLVNLVLAFVLVWLLGKMHNPGFGGILMACLAVGFVSFCFQPYPAFIWYKTPGIWVELFDVIAGFGLAGLWLGWWLTRGKKA